MGRKYSIDGLPSKRKKYREMTNEEFVTHGIKHYKGFTYKDIIITDAAYYQEYLKRRSVLPPETFSFLKIVENKKLNSRKGNENKEPYEDWLNAEVLPELPGAEAFTNYLKSKVKKGLIIAAKGRSKLNQFSGNEYIVRIKKDDSDSYLLGSYYVLDDPESGRFMYVYRGNVPEYSVNQTGQSVITLIYRYFLPNKSFQRIDGHSEIPFP